MKKFNGLAAWAIVAIMCLTIVYNSITTNIVLKNDVKHLNIAVKEIKENIQDIHLYLLGRPVRAELDEEDMPKI